ncbi:MAG: uroporphyrinogen decarboxylase family protein [Armatimonadota bacterium]|nr:uroporphyrinogen decarboxylase family protein [Armatimonadota bacterium]
MTSRERVRTIIAGGKPDRCAFWLGMPHPDTWPIYLEYFGFSTQEELRVFLQDDLRWISAEWGSYKHPDGKPMWNPVRTDDSGRTEPVFAHCEDPREVDAWGGWPSVEYLDFSETLERLRNAGDVYRASGMWSCFFHIVADFFGMENYFIKMFTHPEVVDAVTRNVCEFYLEANRRFFELAGSEMDAFFFGNDLGTQLDLIIGPEQIERFVMPYTQKLIDLARSYGYQIMHHCCGSIHKIIDRFIEVGIQALHPLQARAVGMDAESLASRFKGRIAFIGGIDTQLLLVRGTPEDVKAEVRRVKNLLGPNLVVSPSHEAILPNVPPQNVLAMAEAARED